MKLRLRKNSVRIRLNRREVDALASGASLEDEVQFPQDSRLLYRLEPCMRQAAEAEFHEGVIRISVPQSQIASWATGENIGIYLEFPAATARLSVAIEKDLECVDAPAEERDPDAFPRAGAKSC